MLKSIPKCVPHHNTMTCYDEWQYSALIQWVFIRMRTEESLHQMVFLRFFELHNFHVRQNCLNSLFNMAPFRCHKLSSLTLNIHRILERKFSRHGTWMIVMKTRDSPITRNRRNLCPQTNLLVSIFKEWGNHSIINIWVFDFWSHYVDLQNLEYSAGDQMLITTKLMRS